MSKSNFLFTSESVTEGHPDKMADQISDAVLDAVLADDPAGRVACEVLLTTGICVVAGEISTKTYVDVPNLVRGVIADIGYTDPSYGFDAVTCGVLNAIQSQSPDIAMGVDTGGAGDQGLMFGFACDETEDLMPAPIYYSHRLAEKLAEERGVRVTAMLREFVYSALSQIQPQEYGIAEQADKEAWAESVQRRVEGRQRSKQEKGESDKDA